jgi:hypothetical protein
MQRVPEQGVPQSELVLFLGGDRDEADPFSAYLSLVRRLGQQMDLMAALDEGTGYCQKRMQVAGTAQRDDGELHRPGPPKH